MTFLKKLGEILVKGGAILTGLSPLFPQYSKETGVAKTVVDEAIYMVVNVEAIGQALSLSGADKLKAATPLMSNIILRTDFLAGKKINQPELFRAGVEEITNGLVKVLNSVDAAEAPAPEV